MISMVGGEVQDKLFVDLEFVFVFIFKKRMVGSEAREESIVDIFSEFVFVFVFKKRLDSVDVLVLGNI